MVNRSQKPSRKSVPKRKGARAKSLNDIIEVFNPGESVAHSMEAPVIWVHQFTEDAAREFGEALTIFEEDKDVNKILVRVDSFGGDVYAVLAMIESIEHCSKPVYTACSGKAMSAGALLLSAGKKRFIGKYSTVMVHQVQGENPGGTTAQVQRDAGEQVRLQNLYTAILAKNCKKKIEDIKALIKDNIGADIYLTPKQAKTLGLVDEIGLPKPKRKTIWQFTVGDESDDEDDTDDDN